MHIQKNAKPIKVQLFQWNSQLLASFKSMFENTMARCYEVETISAWISWQFRWKPIQWLSNDSNSNTHTLSLSCSIQNLEFSVEKLFCNLNNNYRLHQNISSFFFFLSILVESIHAMCTHLVFILKIVVTALVGFLLMHSPTN